MSPDSPPPPGLADELRRQGDTLFRWRSYPPLLVLALVVGEVAVDPLPAGGPDAAPLWAAAGLFLGTAGLVLRAWTAGTVPAGTSGRGTAEQRAETLNTTGVYSLVRHPLYLGNALLWLGVTAVGGAPSSVLVVTLVFGLYYERIMMAEERYLWDRHGDAFRAWAERTPAILPRLSSWRPSPHPFSMRLALGRDYPALYAFVAATTAVIWVREVGAGQGVRLPPPWLAWFAAGTAAYVVLRLLKRLTHVFEVPGR